MEIDQEEVQFKDACRRAVYKSIKSRLRNVCSDVGYCALCFDNADEMHNINEEFVLSDWECDTVLTLKVILYTVLRKAEATLASNKICDKCRNEATRAYLFVQNSKRYSTIMQTYLNQLDSRLDEVKRMIDQSADNDFANTVLVIDDPLSAGQSSSKPSRTPNKNNGNYICDLCDKEFYSKRGIASHMKIIHGKNLKGQRLLNKYTRRYDCPDCDTDSCIHYKYLQYIKKNNFTTRSRITCPDCDYVCYSKAILIAHVNKVHLRIFHFKCELCSKPLHSKMAYKMHMKVYHSDRYMCEFCDKYYGEIRNLKNHREICKSVKREFKCQICPASFDTNEKLITHRRKHVESFPCHLCNRKLYSATTLKRHIEMHNTSNLITNKYFLCPICNKSFTSSKERDLHVPDKHRSDEMPTCLVCNLDFHTIKDFVKHMRSKEHIKNARPRERIPCTYCNYTTTTLFNLESHVNRYHLKIRPFACEVCGKRFTSKHRITEHSKIHQLTRTHRCELCDKLLCNSTALKKHMRLHTGERPYMCTMCGEGFVSSSMLNFHVLKMHTANKTIKCPLCATTFYTLPNMRSHFKKVHWKNKNEAFDFKKVKELKEEDYDLFRDRRLIVM